MVVPGLMGRLATVHFDVPSATPLSPLSVDHRTTVIPDPCEATPASESDAAVVLNRAAAVGSRIRTTGGGTCASDLDGCCGFGLDWLLLGTLADALLIRVAAGWGAGVRAVVFRGWSPYGDTEASTLRLALDRVVDVAGGIAGLGLNDADGCFAVDVTLSTATPVLPAASCAVTVMTVVPVGSAITGVLQPPVPNAVPVAPRSVAHVTWVTPTLSVAVPATVTLDMAVVSELAVVGV